jgi:hypothetical protein
MFRLLFATVTQRRAVHGRVVAKLPIDQSRRDAVPTRRVISHSPVPAVVRTISACIPQKSNWPPGSQFSAKYVLAPV